MRENKDNIEKGEVSRRDFLVGAGAVVVGGAIGAGITYPLVAGKGGEVTTTTKTVSVPTTVTTTVGGGATVTSTVTSTVGGGATVTTTLPGSTVTITQPGGDGAVEPAFEPEEMVAAPVGSNNMGPIVVDVKNNKIIRCRGLHHTESYTEAEVANTKWKFEAKHRKTGQTVTFESLPQSKPGYLCLSFKKRVYSPRRLLYPMKRVDWEPGGDPAKINPQNRGISKYKRISWDEATDIIASEVKRVQEKYGAYGIIDKSDAAHRLYKTVHGSSAPQYVTQMLDKVGVTSTARNADSWEGWYYGTMHVWGTGANGLARPAGNQILDISENTDMLVIQGCDQETTPTSQSAGYAPRVARFFHHLGIKEVYIAPDANFQNMANPDKWIPVLPGRDDALQCAIVHTFLKEDIWDKDYVATHVVGMEYIEDYIMGRSDDMVEKTPEWAAPRCGVPEWTIKALARQWAAKKTSTYHHLGGPMIRGPFTHETARWHAVILGMQAMGSPGRQQFGQYGGPAMPSTQASLRGKGTGFAHLYPPYEPQVMPKTMQHIAIMEGHTETWGCGALAAPREDQFIKYVYPLPADEGGTEVHMIWQDHSCMINCWNDGNYYIHAIRNPKIECYVFQHPWMENDLQYGDILLPISTPAEEKDVVTCQGECRILQYHEKAVQPIGESKSDWEAVAEVAKKLEKYGGVYTGCLEALTKGQTEESIIQTYYDLSGLANFGITYAQMKEKKYFIAPLKEDWKSEKRGMIDFYTDPVANPLVMPTGKLEFYCQQLADAWPDDNERGPYPKYQPGGPGTFHDESLDTEWGAERCKKYPFIIISNHVRWRLHGQSDDVPWIREIPTCKIKGFDGYAYEPVWINPVDAAKLGVVHGDIVKVWNNRGIELGAAYVTARIIPGAVYMDHGTGLDIINDKDEDFGDRETKWISRGGTLNQISPTHTLSQNCIGMVESAYLVAVEKLSFAEYEEWREKYPTSFDRALDPNKYEPYYGLKIGAWMEGGN